MKSWRTKVSACLLASTMIVAHPLPIGSALAQDIADPNQPTVPASAKDMAGSGAKMDESGFWRMKSTPDQMQTVEVMATGGPDDYGYIWDNSAPFSWIEATAGTDTGLSGNSSNKRTGPIPLPFPFKYYAQVYTTVYIGASGYLAFQDAPDWYWMEQANVPSPTYPNPVIAPYSTPLTLSTSGKKGRVFYHSGGAAPNRYFVVAWNEVTIAGEDEKYTFEVVLNENGNVLFQYKTMSYGIDDGYYCGYVGIEDADGLDGMKYSSCDSIASNTALRFTRPPATARVKLNPRGQGRFTRAGNTEYFQVMLSNNGELGSDTYNVTLSSPWAAAMTIDNGQPLADTNGDGIADTGPIAQGQSLKVAVQVQTPTVASVADGTTATLTDKSIRNPAWQRSAVLRTTVPIPFAQVYQDDANIGPRIALSSPDGQIVRKLGSTASFGGEIAVAAMPGGGYFYAWDEYIDRTWQIRYAVLDSNGALISTIRTLTGASGSILAGYAGGLGAVSAPNGNIGLAWRQTQSRQTNGVWEYNYNVYMAIVDASGTPVLLPTNLTNNNAWGALSTLNVPRYYYVHIAASGDNRFFVAWSQSVRTATAWPDNIFYTVLGTDGQIVRGVTRYSADASTDADRADVPRLAALSGNRILLAYYSYSGDRNGVVTAALSSSGERIAGPILVTDEGWSPWAVTQFSNGSILVVWQTWNNNRAGLGYAVLNDGSLTKLAGPTRIDNPSSATGDFGPSAAADADNRAVVTWGENDGSYRPYQFYALIAANGTLLTPATPGFAALASSSGRAPAIRSSYNGYGVAPSLGFAPVSTTQPDATVTVPALNTGAPGASAQLAIRVNNAGLVATGGVTVTAELDPLLTFVGATPAPTQEAMAAAAGATLTWNLPSLAYLSQGLIVLNTGIPTTTVGSRYPVTVTVTTTGPDFSMTNNTVRAEVMAADQVFLSRIGKADE